MIELFCLYRGRTNHNDNHSAGDNRHRAPSVVETEFHSRTPLSYGDFNHNLRADSKQVE